MAERIKSLSKGTTLAAVKTAGSLDHTRACPTQLGYGRTPTERPWLSQCEGVTEGNTHCRLYWCFRAFPRTGGLSLWVAWSLWSLLIILDQIQCPVQTLLFRKTKFTTVILSLLLISCCIVSHFDSAAVLFVQMHLTATYGVNNILVTMSQCLAHVLTDSSLHKHTCASTQVHGYACILRK